MGATVVTAARPPDNLRLPGPHYVLETALRGQEPDQYDRERDKQRNMSAAGSWFRPKTRPCGESSVMMTPAMAGAPDEEAVVPPNGAPEIPMWLAEARSYSLQDSSTTADANPWLSAQSGVRLGLGGTYMMDNMSAWQVGPQQTEYNAALGLSEPRVLSYERAQGISSTAIIPPMHSGSSEAAGNERYARASDAQHYPPDSPVENESCG
jgi:hypothetical protein